MKYKRLFQEVAKYTFIGMCDRLRLNNPENENKWLNMMKFKKKITDSKFIKECDTSKILDDNEDINVWIEENKMSDSSSQAYSSKWGTKSCIFY